MINRSREIYTIAMDQLRGFSTGQLDINPPPGQEASLLIETSQPDPEIVAADVLSPEPTLRIIYSPRRGKVTEFVFDPQNFSKIPRSEPNNANPGLLSRLFRGPRDTADMADLNELRRVFNHVSPTREFQEQINQRAQALRDAEVADRRIADQERQALEARLAQQSIEIALRKEASLIRVAEEKAVDIRERTQKTEGAHFLGIIFDDYPAKAKQLYQQYQSVAEDLNYGIFFEWLSEEEEAVRIIAGLQRLNARDPQLPVLVFMDGNLPGKYGSGLAATRALKRMLDHENLPMPLLVGNAGSPEDNEALKEVFNEKYITTVRRDNPRTYWSLKTTQEERKAWDLEPWLKIGACLNLSPDRE